MSQIGNEGVKKNSGAIVGIQPSLNFIEGANVTLTIANDPANHEIDITIAAAGGAGVSASATVTISSGNLIQAWNHAQNTSDVCATPLDEPNSFWWMTIDDANNITMHIASLDLENNHSFRVLVF